MIIGMFSPFWLRHPWFLRLASVCGRARPDKHCKRCYWDFGAWRIKVSLFVGPVRTILKLSRQKADLWQVWARVISSHHPISSFMMVCLCVLEDDGEIELSVQVHQAMNAAGCMVAVKLACWSWHWLELQC
jgi:hypothetical protein